MSRQRLTPEERHVAALACAAFLIEDLGLSAHNAASLLNPTAIGIKRQSLERRFAGPEKREARCAAIRAGRALAENATGETDRTASSNGVTRILSLEAIENVPQPDAVAVNDEREPAKELSPTKSPMATNAEEAVPSDFVAVKTANEWREEVARHRNDARTVVDRACVALDARLITEDGGGGRDETLQPDDGRVEAEEQEDAEHRVSSLDDSISIGDLSVTAAREEEERGQLSKKRPR